MISNCEVWMISILYLTERAVSVGIILYFFFFQAEDGIRDHCVTGVQTCALPISLLNFENFEAALLGSRSAQDDEILHANFRGQVCKSAIG